MATLDTQKDLKSKASDIGLMVLGAMVIIVHLVLYRFNASLFNGFLSLYIITYSIIVLVYVYKQKSKSKTESYDSRTSFDAVTYISFYTIFLYAFMFILSVIGFIISRR